MAEDTTAAGQGDTNTGGTTAAATTTDATAATATAAAASTQDTAAGATTTGTTDAAQAATAPETYELTVPDGAPFDDADIAAIAAEAKALGITNDQAQALVGARAQQLATYRAELRTQLEADPDLGGANLPMTEVHARAGRDYLFPKGTKGSDLVLAWFDKTGLGNHPEFVRAMTRIGKSLAEDRPNTGGGASPNQVTSREDRMFPSSAKASA